MKIFSGAIVLAALTVSLTGARAQPTITQQPQNQAVTNGGTAVFSVSVSGTGPFAYQWQFNGTNLPPIITTVAGDGPSAYSLGSYSGDGGAATNAGLFNPSGVAVDAAGNLFIADTINNRIRKVSTNGIITTVAGNGYTNQYGAGSFSGDGGAATNAELYYPGGVAVDSYGNLFIADADNNRIRKVDTNGIISTVAGNGTQGFSGDGGQATNAELTEPSDVAFDNAGNLFISDAFRIRKVGTNGIITTVAGNGTQGYSGDGGAATNAELSGGGVAVDGVGNLFFADCENQRIRKVSTNGIISTVAGNGYTTQYSWGGFSGDGGQATNAELSLPTGVAVDTIGNLFIADYFNDCIRKVDTNGIITTVAGNGSPGFAGYSGDGGPATSAALYGPSGVAVDTKGNLFIADTYNQRIRKVLASGMPALILNNVSSLNAGNYQVVISNSSGSVTSRVATLCIVFITQQPQSQFVPVSGNAFFYVDFFVLTNSYQWNFQWYFSNPSFQTPAGAIAEMAYGFVYDAVVTNGGSGYTTTPQVQFIGGGGSGAAGTAVVSNGMVTAINMMSAGSNYTSLPTVQIGPPNGLLIGETNSWLNLNAITTNNAGNYFVVWSSVLGSVTSSVAVLSVGYSAGIIQEPQSVNVAQGSTVTFNVIPCGTPPFGYQWWMSASQQSNATAVPIVLNGFVVSNSITSGGAGYLSVPQVQFVGGSGSEAAGTAVVSNGMVTAINMADAGSGYTTPPAIQIAAPSAISLSGQTNATLTLPAVTPGNAANYFVVVTNNFGSVTSAVAQLVVFIPPQFSIARSANGSQFTLQWRVLRDRTQVAGIEWEAS